MQITGSGSTVSAAASPVLFSETIVPTAVSGSYRLGLVLVTIAMILVPLVYLSLIAAVAWFLVWHLTANSPLLQGTSGMQGKLFAYLTPAVVSGTLLFFMVKPILARRSHRSDPVHVPEAEQPMLHALIREICRQVRAPRPSRVQVDCQVNASAALRGGVLSRDLDLTIGLPLVVGLSVRELSGVLAHEFGHFAQGGGIRMTTVIRRINAWLFRVVHERDTWDDQLEAWSEGGEWRVMIPMALASGSVWLSRKVLAGLALVGHGVSCYMLRQMEFDADSYEVKIAGSDAFTRTVVRLRELSASSQMASNQLEHLFEKRLIPVDLSRYLAECTRLLPDDVRVQLHDSSDEKTGMFDTHPCDRDRVAAALALDARGALVGGDEPASILFRDFDRLSAAVTRHHYERNLGIELDQVRLITIDEALHAADDEHRTRAAVRGFFGGRVSVTRPLHIPLDTAAGELSLDQAFDAARAAVHASSASEDAYRRFEQYQHRLDLAFAAEQLLHVGANLNAESFQLPTAKLAAAQSIQSWAAQEQEKLRPELDAFDRLMARRLACAVLMLDRETDSQDTLALASALNALADALPYVVRARRFVLAIEALEEAARGLPIRDEYPDRMERLTADADECRARSFEIFTTAPIPAGELSEAWRELLAAAPQLSTPGFLNGLMDLYWKCLSRLVRLASDAEASRSDDNRRQDR